MTDDVKVNKIPYEEYIKLLDEKRKNLECVIEKHFPKKYFALETCLSVASQLLIEDVTLPFALFLIDVPSSSKTTILDIVSSIPNCYKSDKFTSKSFVSHSARATKKQLSEIDLLPKIKNKIFITPELAPLFTGNEDTLVETFGILTRVLDGSGLVIDSGVHGSRGYSGNYHFMWLGAIVEIPRKVWRTIGNLGAKWYYLRMPKETQTVDQKIQTITKNLLGIPYRKRVEECKDATKQFWSCLIDQHEGSIVWNKEKNDPVAFRRIVEISVLLSRLRASIPTFNTSDSMSSGSNYGFGIPIVEDPSRASSALYSLARGHAVLYGRNYITLDDLGVVISVAFSSAERERVELLNLLLQKNGKIDVETFVKYSKVSHNTARKEIQKMNILGIVNVQEEPTNTKPKIIGILKEEFSWLVSEEFQKYYKSSNSSHTYKNFAESTLQSKERGHQ